MSILGMGGSGGEGGGASDLGAGFGASFKEFCEHPDNRQMMVQHQQKEIHQMQKASAKVSALEFREKVLESDYEAQNNIAPFLENRVLRRIIKTFTNDPKGDFAKWARNPLVIQMLTRAKDMIESGRISEEEAEHLIVQSLKQPGAEGQEEFKAKTERKTKVETKDLVSALNEHLELRMEGNKLYGGKKFEEARSKYDEALSIVTIVSGMSGNDQKEIDMNRAACLMNIGAVCMEVKDFGEAVQILNEAQALLPNNIKLFMRRARAHTSRGDFSDAMADIERVRKLDPESWEVDEALAHVKAVQQKALAKEKAMAKKALHSAGN